MPPVGQNKGGMPWGGKLVTWTSAFVIGVSCMTFFSLVMQPNPPVRAFSIVKKSKDVAHDKNPRKLLSSSDHHEAWTEKQRLEAENQKLTDKLDAPKKVQEKPEKDVTKKKTTDLPASSTTTWVTTSIPSTTSKRDLGWYGVLPEPIMIKEVIHDILFLAFLVLVAFSPCWCFRDYTPRSRSEKACVFLGIVAGFGVAILFLEPFHYVAKVPVFNLYGEMLNASGETQDALDSLTNGTWVDSKITAVNDTDKHSVHHWLQMPMPLWPHVHSAMNGESQRRRQFWLSRMFLNLSITMILGSALLLGAPRFLNSRDFTLVDTDGGWQLDNLKRGRLCGLATFAHLTIVTKIMLTSVWSDRLSLSFGPDWEGYAVVLDSGLLWMLLQALALVYARPGAQFGKTAFAEASLATVMPFLADPFDTLKDCLFAAFALDDPLWVSQAIGCASLAWLWSIHIFMLRDDELRLELEGSYLSVLLINPVVSGAGELQNQPEDPVTAETGCCCSLYIKVTGKLLPPIFKQTTPERGRALAIEDSPQGVLAVCFSLVQYLKHGVVKPVVVVLNIAVPLFRYILAWYLYNKLRNSEIVRQWLDDEFIKAAHGGNLGKADFFVKHRKGILGPGTVDAANRYLEMVGINKAEVILRYHDLGWTTESFKVLASFAQANSICDKLDIGESGIEGSAVTALLGELLKVNSMLQKLDFNYNDIGDSGAEALGEGLKVNGTLQTLSLWSSRIGDTGAQALAEALKVNGTLQTLHLSVNGIGYTGAQALGEALKVNGTLQTLDLDSNRIGDRGVQALAEALKVNSTLETLYLYENDIGDSGAEALGEALKAEFGGRINLVD